MVDEISSSPLSDPEWSPPGPSRLGRGVAPYGCPHRRRAAVFHTNRVTSMIVRGGCYGRELWFALWKGLTGGRTVGVSGVDVKQVRTFKIT